MKLRIRNQLQNFSQLLIIIKFFLIIIIIIIINIFKRLVAKMMI